MGLRAKQLWAKARAAVQAGQVKSDMTNAYKTLLDVDLPRFRLGEVLSFPSGHAAAFLARHLKSRLGSSFTSGVRWRVSLGCFSSAFWYVLASQFRSDVPPRYLEGLFLNMAYHYALLFCEVLTAMSSLAAVRFAEGIVAALLETLYNAFPGNSDSLGTEFQHLVRECVYLWFVGARTAPKDVCRMASTEPFAQSTEANASKAKVVAGAMLHHSVRRVGARPPPQTQKERHGELMSAFLQEADSIVSRAHAEEDPRIASLHSRAAGEGIVDGKDNKHHSLKSRTQYTLEQSRSSFAKSGEMQRTSASIADDIAVPPVRPHSEILFCHQQTRLVASKAKAEARRAAEEHMLLAQAPSKRVIKLLQTEHLQYEELSTNSLSLLLRTFLDFCAEQQQQQQQESRLTPMQSTQQGDSFRLQQHESVERPSSALRDRSFGLAPTLHDGEREGREEQFIYSLLRRSPLTVFTRGGIGLEASTASVRKHLPSCPSCLAELHLYSKLSGPELPTECVKCRAGALSAHTQQFLHCVLCHVTYCRKCVGNLEVGSSASSHNVSVSHTRANSVSTASPQLSGAIHPSSVTAIPRGQANDDFPETTPAMVFGSTLAKTVFIPRSTAKAAISGALGRLRTSLRAMKILSATTSQRSLDSIALSGKRKEQQMEFLKELGKQSVEVEATVRAEGAAARESVNATVDALLSASLEGASQESRDPSKIHEAKLDDAKKTPAHGKTRPSSRCSSSQPTTVPRPGSAPLRCNGTFVGSYLLTSDLRGKERSSVPVSVDSRDQMPAYNAMLRPSSAMASSRAALSTASTATMPGERITSPLSVSSGSSSGISSAPLAAYSSRLMERGAALCGYRRSIKMKWTATKAPVPEARSSSTAAGLTDTTPLCNNGNEKEPSTWIEQAKQIISRVRALHAIDRQASKERAALAGAHQGEHTRRSLAAMQQQAHELQDLKKCRAGELYNTAAQVVSAMEATVGHWSDLLEEIDTIKTALITINNNFEVLPENFRVLARAFSSGARRRLGKLIDTYKNDHRDRELWPDELTNYYCTRAMARRQAVPEFRKQSLASLQLDESTEFKESLSIYPSDGMLTMEELEQITSFSAIPTHAAQALPVSKQVSDAQRQQRRSRWSVASKIRSSCSNDGEPADKVEDDEAQTLLQNLSAPHSTEGVGTTAVEGATPPSQSKLRGVAAALGSRTRSDTGGKEEQEARDIQMEKVLGLQREVVTSDLYSLGGTIFWNASGRRIGSAADEFRAGAILRRAAAEKVRRW